MLDQHDDIYYYILLLSSGILLLVCRLYKFIRDELNNIEDLENEYHII